MAKMDVDPGQGEETEAEEEFGEEDIASFDLSEQLGDGEDDAGGEEAGDSGVEEALRAWAAGGHAAAELEEGDQVKPVDFAQLEPGVSQAKVRSSRLNNVKVTVSVELGRKYMSVREIVQLKEQDFIELDKVAGESFEIRVNGRMFALGEVVVVTDLMAVRITALVETVREPEPGEEE